MAGSCASTSGKVLVNGVELFYESKGSGSHVLLCIPGALGTTKLDFAPQVSYFGSREGFRIIAFDPRGYGNSRPPERKFSDRSTFIEDAKDGKGLMDTLGVTKFSVLGWSDGAMSAIILASMFPESTITVVPWGANCFIGEEDVKVYREGKDMSTWEPHLREPWETEYGKEGAQKLWGSWVEMTEEIYHNGGNICKDHLGSVKCPTLLLHGMKDPWIPNYHPVDIEKGIADCTVYYFPDGDHEIHLNQADKFNQVVENFLNGKSHQNK